jgi:parallel beta-helix repeat protein
MSDVPSVIAAIFAFIAGSVPGTPTPPAVFYTGPTGTLAGPVTLTAEAIPGDARVVAVTFLLDGKPLGSDTTSPFQLDVDAGLLPRGRHELVAEAVDALYNMATTPPLSVRTKGPAASAVVATPTEGLEEALVALRRGGVTVRLEPGRYRLANVAIGSDVTLIGSGKDTVIEPPPGTGYQSVLSVGGSGITISDLAIDGGGPGAGAGSAIEVRPGSSEVRLQRLRLEHVRRVGVLAWGRHADVSVQDSTIEGDGLARVGVVTADPGEPAEYRDASVIRTLITGFRYYGISFQQIAHGDVDAARYSLALGNRVRNIADPERLICLEDRNAPGCGTNEGGIWSGGADAAILGNTVRGARWDAIQTVGTSDRVAIVGNVVSNTRTGIYLEHSTNDSLITRNRVTDVETGIKVEWRYGAVGSDRNVFSRNRIVLASHAAILVEVGANGNSIVANAFVRTAVPAIHLVGSSNNLVRGNVVCGATDGPLVEERTLPYDDGTPAVPSGNVLDANEVVASCEGATR